MLENQVRRTISNWIFTACDFCRLKIQLFGLDFSNLIFSEIEYRSTGGQSGRVNLKSKGQKIRLRLKQKSSLHSAYIIQQTCCKKYTSDKKYRCRLVKLFRVLENFGYTFNFVFVYPQKIVDLKFSTG